MKTYLQDTRCYFTLRTKSMREKVVPRLPGGLFEGQQEQITLLSAKIIKEKRLESRCINTYELVNKYRRRLTLFKHFDAQVHLYDTVVA